MTRDLSCRDFADFLWAYLSGEVSEAERREFELHLAKCPSCVAYMSSYRTATELGKSAFRAGDAPVPEEAPEELVQAILSARAR